MGSLGTGFISKCACVLICVLCVCVCSSSTSMCSVLREGLCRWNKQWRDGGRPVGRSSPWERGAGDVTSDRAFQTAKREDGPSCPSAAAAFC